MSEPNAVTKAVLAEYEEMRKNPSAYKRYHSVDELFDEVLEDIKGTHSEYKAGALHRPGDFYNFSRPVEISACKSAQPPL
ncbi:MAG: hypothetical protein IKR84_06190 [Oscillibacter sp.]|nr:hypothetical protein [Oscillibacter sp.]